MAKFRQIYCDFWENAYIQEELTPEDKLFYLYIMTNPKTTQLGVYSITFKQMAFDLGYSMETIKSLMLRFEQHHKLIRYDDNTKEIAVLKWGKNFNKGGTPMECCVKKEFREVKNKELVKMILPDIKNEKMKQFIENLFEKVPERKADEGNKNKGSCDTSPDTCDDTGGIKNNNKNNNKNNINISSKDDIEKVYKKWNEIAEETGLSKVRDMTEPRNKAINARIQKHGLECVLETMEKIKLSDFLLGNKKSWKADFNFFIKASSFQKIKEDSFTDKEVKGSERSKKTNSVGSDKPYISAYERLKQQRG